MKLFAIIAALTVIAVGGFVLAGEIFGDGSPQVDPGPTGQNVSGDDPDRPGQRPATDEELAEIRETLEANAAQAREKVSEFNAGTAATGTAPLISSGGQAPQTMEQFLTDVINNVDRFWTQAYAGAGLGTPQVSYHWLPVGQHGVTTQCVDTSGSNAVNDRSAFYCSLDDTIFFAQDMASDLWNGLLDAELPGSAGGQGHAVGDFGVAYVVAHEYAHNVQTELGIYDNYTGVVYPRAFELMADCMSGAWARSAYNQGMLEIGDIEEAISTAQAVGNFDIGSSHGSPRERAEAFNRGYGTGNAADCDWYLDPNNLPLVDAQDDNLIILP